MGILGFQKLQEELDGGCIKLQMMERLREWKLEHPDEQAIVVIRLKELLISVIQLNVKAAIFGGSHRYYHEQLEKFFQHFQALNVKLVFFGEGMKPSDKLLKYQAKIDQDYRKYNQLLKHIDKTNEVKTISRPELRICLGLYEEGIARKYGEYILSTDLLNKDIVRYCLENANVVAILAKDSDFLLHNIKSVEYWSCGVEHLNFNDMTTLSFSKAALLDHLNLTPSQFHVMLAIAGVILDDCKKHRCFVSKDVLKEKRCATGDIIKSVSDFVRDKLPETYEKPNFGEWATLTFTKHLEEYCWLIEKQYKKYDISSSNCLASAADTNVCNKFKGIWAVVNNGVVRVNLNFLDLNKWQNNRNAMKFSNLVVLVLKRAMGVVLNAQKGERPKRRFFIKEYDGERCKMVAKSLTFAPFEHPNIEELLDESKSGDEELTNMKWNLFFWTLHLDFDDDLKRKIRDLPKDILPVVVTVLFLLWENQITPMEGDTIIISENEALNKEPSDGKVDYPTKPDGRTIRVAHIYVHTRVLINRCFQFCGIDLFNIPVLFDGIDFHNLMDAFVQNANEFENKKSQIAAFEVNAF